MAVLSIYLDTRKKNSSDVYPVKFRIYHNKAFFISSECIQMLIHGIMVSMGKKNQL